MKQASQDCYSKTKIINTFSLGHVLHDNHTEDGYLTFGQMMYCNNPIKLTSKPLFVNVGNIICRIKSDQLILGNWGQGGE